MKPDEIEHQEQEADTPAIVSSGQDGCGYTRHLAPGSTFVDAPVHVEITDPNVKPNSFCYLPPEKKNEPQ